MRKAFCLILFTLVLSMSLFSCDKTTSYQGEETRVQTGETETRASETEDLETEQTETNVPETVAQILRPEGFELEKALQSDIFKAKNSLKIPYSLYIPEGYSDVEKYPLLVYLYPTSPHNIPNKDPMAEVGILFEHPSSPVYKSIVLIADDVFCEITC